MGEGEAATHKHLKANREKVFDLLVAEHRGRIVKFMGHGLLAAFGSLVAAVVCAMEWQGPWRSDRQSAAYSDSMTPLVCARR